MPVLINGTIKGFAGVCQARLEISRGFFLSNKQGISPENRRRYPHIVRSGPYKVAAPE
jgi:hypothetical protein